MQDLGETDQLAETEYKIMCDHLNCMNCCFLYPNMGPLYLNILYLERILSTEAAMFFTVAQTGQTKHLLSF